MAHESILINNLAQHSSLYTKYIIGCNYMTRLLNNIIISIKLKLSLH